MGFMDDHPGIIAKKQRGEEANVAFKQLAVPPAGGTESGKAALAPDATWADAVDYRAAYMIIADAIENSHGFPPRVDSAEVMLIRDALKAKITPETRENLLTIFSRIECAEVPNHMRDTSYDL